MLGGLAAVWPDAQFGAAAHFAPVERRLAGNALDAWIAGGGAPVAGFEANALLIADPGGAATVASAGAAVTLAFGLAAGAALDGRQGLAAELLAACHLIALTPEPIPFEACLRSGRGGRVMARGVALPVRCDGAEMVQAVLSWREVLDRAATARLRREFTQALKSARFSRRIDPFAPRNAT